MVWQTQEAGYWGIRHGVTHGKQSWMKLKQGWDNSKKI